eukprot:tig00000076_g2406.t1
MSNPPTPKKDGGLLEIPPAKPSILLVGEKSGAPEKPIALKTERVAVPSALLGRVAEFLPQIAKANETLQEQIEASTPDAFDIEKVDEENGHYIEMNLAMGIFDVQKREDSAADGELRMPGDPPKKGQRKRPLVQEVQSKE